MKTTIQKLFLLTLIFALVFMIVACTPKQTVVCDDGSEVSSEDACPTVVEETEEPAVVKEKTTTTKVAEPVEEEVVISIPEELQDLFSRKTKVKSMFYDYREGREVTLPTYKTYMKGDVIKMDLPVQTQVLYKNNIDTVKLYQDTKKAEGFCQSEKFCKVSGQKVSVSYSDYYKETPFDWLNKIRTAEKIGNERMYGRGLIVVNVNDGQYTYFVDEFYGLPVRIFENDEEIRVFDNPLFNTLTDADIAFKGVTDDYSRN